VKAESFFVTVVSVVTLVVSFVAPVLAQAPERIAEIRVHGNHTTPDADVIAMSGLKVGDPVSDAALEQAARSIRVLHRFTDADVRKRYLSISDPSQVLIMIVVDEKAGISDTDLTPGVGRRLRAAGMFLPILNFRDGYGFTYGVRTTFPHVPDENTRVSVPLSWGGERRVGVEVEHWFGGSRGFYGVGRRDPQVRLLGGLSIYRTVNPHYAVADLRHEAKLRVEKPIGTWLRFGSTVKTARVAFGPEAALSPGAEAALSPGAEAALSRTTDRHDSFLADVVVDTRIDPSFPRNAVYLSVGREQLRWNGGADPPPSNGPMSTSAGRWLTDLRGYAGVGGAAVLAVRGQFVNANRFVPLSEQPLLGGTDTLRGYQAGVAAGDNLAAISTELRYPLTSPLHAGRFGVKGFVDWGTTWAAGAKLADAEWRRGIGGGIFFGAGPVLIDLAAAWPQHGSGRFNFGLGVSF
jgi:outer membrane protein assembly factor BamA